MKNFIPPKNILGIIKMKPKGWADKYFIGEASFAIEKIGDNKMLNIWGSSFHYEMHEGKEILIGGMKFEIMQPIKEDLIKNKFIQIDFPSDEIEKVENNWEELYFSHFYQFEHLAITDWQIKIIAIPNEDIYEIEIKGYVTDDIRKHSMGQFIEATFKTKLETKINSQCNWKYALNNPNAINNK